MLRWHSAFTSATDFTTLTHAALTTATGFGFLEGAFDDPDRAALRFCSLDDFINGDIAGVPLPVARPNSRSTAFACYSSMFMCVPSWFDLSPCGSTVLSASDFLRGTCFAWCTREYSDLLAQITRSREEERAGIAS